MAKSSTIKVNLWTTGDGVNESVEQTPLASSASAYKSETLALSNGNNALAPPAGATFLYLSGGTVPLFLKGVNGDTGWSIGTGQAALLPLGGAAYVLNATGVGTVNAEWR